MIVWTLLLLPFKLLFYILLSKAFMIFFLVYAVLSFFVVKFIFFQTKKYRTFQPEDAEKHERYKMFRRFDAEHWNELRLFIGAITFSWIKLIGVLLILVVSYLRMRILLWGLSLEEIRKIKDIETVKKIQTIGSQAGRYFRMILGVVVTQREVKMDYSKYLGPNYTRDESQVRVASYICNHTSWLDIPIMMDLVGCSFISRIEVARYPLIGFIAECIGCIFVDRNDKSNRSSSMAMVAERQQRIYSQTEDAKFLVFPEGTTSNATSIIPFRKGAFALKLPVKPICVRFNVNNRISLAMDIIEMLYHLFILLCVLIHPIEVLTLPAFEPNDYLFKTYAEGKGYKEDWEVYADVIRDIMCEASGLHKGQGNFDMKKEYLDFLRNPKKNQTKSK